MSEPFDEPRIAINTASTPGDADSVFRITQPGSYYLTGNTSGVAAKHGIEIDASDVTLDLMGRAGNRRRGLLRVSRVGARGGRACSGR